jgi:hypothetical protein
MPFDDTSRERERQERRHVTARRVLKQLGKVFSADPRAAQLVREVLQCRCRYIDDNDLTGIDWEPEWTPMVARKLLRALNEK